MDVSRLVLPFSFFRAVCKISCCQVNTTSKQGIKQLRISFCSFLLLSFFWEVTRGHEVAEENTRLTALKDSAGYLLLCCLNEYHFVHY